MIPPIQSMINAIAEALFNAFGAEYEIYTEYVEQGLKEPCFTIRCVNPLLNRDLDRRFKQNTLFSIQYFPKTEGQVEECTKVLEKLFEVMPDIPAFGRVIHGTDLEGEISDGVLVFTVQYDIFLLREEVPEPDMEKLKTNMQSKG